MSAPQLQEFQRRAITAERMVQSLQQQLNSLKKEIQCKQVPKRNYNASSNPIDDCKNNTFVDKSNIYPVWYTPYTPSQATREDNIMVLNSLCPSQNVPFVPKNGRLIKWYTCGPTVYAPSHMGHARTYVTFDIIRNILEYYFGFRVNLVMNITDVDDKIILRARQNYLFDEYRSANLDNLDKITTDIDEAFALSLAKRKEAVSLAETEVQNAVEKHKKDMKENLMGQEVKLENVKRDYEAYKKAREEQDTDTDRLLSIGKSALSELLDQKAGNTVKDQRIFRKHAEHFEQEFFEDMRQLHIRDPDVLTRVTEYVPEIIAFVQKLVDNGYGYVSNGSVYFDIEYYIRSGHSYPKLDPKKLDNKLLINEGEGSLASSTIDSERKSHRDFALWKRSKAGEPQWESPWGAGRPGWHIECSAMAANVLGDVVDIHTGGEDLKFPHHDNEMAQSSAFYSNPKCHHFHQQWVNYWFHAGHLHIGGLKMSKSLKNFISIREALEMCSARQIRLLFLLQSWHGKMNYSDDSIEETQAKEHQLSEFFLLMNALNRNYGSEAAVSRTPYLPQNTKDGVLNESVMKRQLEVDEALRDNFDYVTATQTLFDLISEINTYLKGMSDEQLPNILLLNKAASFVNDLLKIFGVIPPNETFFLGSKQIENEKYLQPVLDVITAYRAELTQLFRNKCEWKEYAVVAAKYNETIERLKQVTAVKADEKEKEEKDALGSEEDIGLRRDSLWKALLVFNEKMTVLTSDVNTNASKQLIGMTDALRDDILPKYGVKIEDVEGGKGSIWKLYRVDALLKMLSDAKKKKNLKKLQNKMKQLGKEVDAWSKKAVEPSQLFQQMKDNDGNAMYSQFDENGLPTHDAQGKPLSKKKKKKLPNVLKKQQKAYQQYQKECEKNPNFLKDLQLAYNNAKNDLNL